MLMPVAGKSVLSVADGAFRRSDSKAEDPSDAKDAPHSRIRDSCFYLDAFR